MSDPTTTQPAPVMVVSSVQPQPPPPSPSPPCAHRRLKRFFFRGPMFRFACMLGAMFTVLFLIGFIAPAWYGDDAGLWMSCRHRFRTECITANGAVDSWYEFVRFLECLALICVVLAVAVEVYQDLYKTPPPPDNKAVEILAGLGGTLGLLGVAIFGGKMSEGTSDPPKLGWGFWVTTVSCVLIVVCVIFLARSRVEHRDETEARMAANGLHVQDAGPNNAINMRRPQRDMPRYERMGSPHHPEFHPTPHPAYNPPPSAPPRGPYPQTYAPPPYNAPPAQRPPTSENPAYYATDNGEIKIVMGHGESRDTVQ